MNPVSAWLRNIGLAVEAQQVIGLRHLRLAQGNALATREATTMVTEKIAAFLRCYSANPRTRGTTLLPQSGKRWDL